MQICITLPGIGLTLCRSVPTTLRYNGPAKSALLLNTYWTKLRLTSKTIMLLSANLILPGMFLNILKGVGKMRRAETL